MQTPDQLIPQAEGGDEQALASLLGGPLDPDLLARFAASTLRALQSRAAVHEATPTHGLVALAAIRDLGLRSELLDRPHLDEAVLMAIAESAALVPRILARPDCPMPLLLEAAESNDPDVQRLIAAHPRIGDDILDDLARRTSDPEVEEQLWQRAAEAPERLVAFAAALSPELRTRVARHPATPPELVARLARDLDEDVRAAVAGRSDLSEDLALALATDDAPDVARAARRHPVWQRRQRRRTATMGGMALLALGCAGAGALVTVVLAWVWSTL